VLNAAASRALDCTGVLDAGLGELVQASGHEHGEREHEGEQ
jgi:hypothetical protein